jgi:hypothetical protein
VVAVNKLFKIIGCLLILLTLSSYAVAGPSFMQKINIQNTKKSNTPFISGRGWPQIYDDGYEDDALNIGIDSQDNIIVTGFSFQGSDSNALTIKYDSDGNEIWNTQYNSGKNDAAFLIAVDNNDDIIIFGYSGKLPISEGSCFIVKYSSEGIEQWNYTFSLGECNYPGGITVDSENNIIVTGGSGLWQMNIFYWIIKMDENCVEIWNQTFHEGAIDIGLGVAVDSNDNIIATGFSSTPFVDPVFLIKYDKNGNIIWEKRRPGSEPWDIAIDSQDNIVVTGFGYYYPSITMLTIKCDMNGTLLWVNEFESGAYDGGQSVAIDSNDNIIVGGFSGFSMDEYYEHLVIIYDSYGNELLFKREGVEGLIYGVAVDSLDNIYITGEIFEGIYGYYTTKLTDIAPPEFQLEKPKPFYLHINGKPLLNLPKRTVVLGKLDILINSFDLLDIEYVEVYIDKQLMMTLNSAPFEWAWENRSFGMHNIMIIAYDQTGSAKRIEIDFLKIF